MTNDKKSPICQILEEYEKLPFSFDNMKKKISLTGIMPLYANTGFTETTDKKTGNTILNPWFQIIANYTVSYQRQTESDTTENDNDSSREMKVKISTAHMLRDKVTGSELKKFFEEYFLGKKFLILPTEGEKPQTESKPDSTGVYRPITVKGKFECTVSDELNLKHFMSLFQVDEKPKK